MLPTEERDRIERRYFADEGGFEELGMAENELVDSYVRGELSEEEQRHFRLQYLSSPDRRAKVDFARSLSEAAISASPHTIVRSRPTWLHRLLASAETSRLPRFALACTGLGIACVLLTFLVIQNRGLRQQLQRQGTENVRLRENQETLERQLASTKGAPSQTGTNERPEEQARVEQPSLPGTSLILRSILRGGTSAESVLSLPIRTKSINLRLVLEKDQRASGSLVAEIQQVGGHELPVTIGSPGISHEDGGNSVLIDVPAKSIHEGYYIVTLYALGPDSIRNEVGEFSFRAK